MKVDSIRDNLNFTLESRGFFNIPDKDYVIFCKEGGDYVNFFMPDIMLRRGYIRISGSMGFFFATIDNIIEQSSEIIKKYLNSSISVRTENFPLLSELGIAEDNSYDSAQLVDNILRVLDEKFPKSRDDLCAMCSEKGSLLYNMMIGWRATSAHLNERHAYFTISQICGY